jgi:hypothetical protein
MPSLYEMALMLIRLFAAMYIAIGASILAAMLVIVGLNASIHDEDFHTLSAGVLVYLLEYGIVSLVAGIGLFLLSKTIARHASKG